MNKMITFENVKFAYDAESIALNNIDLYINEGEYTTIIGHNGSGKSTLAKLVIGLLECKDGKITVDNLLMTMENVYEIRNKIGVVFQNPDNQFIGSTVRDDIAFGLENHRIPREQMEDLITGFAAKVNMTNYLESEPTRLSGGQKQRVAIAGVLAMSPKILILDEATSMLDPQGREEINALVHEIHDNNKMTILSITHDIEEVSKSDRVIVLDNGKIWMEGTPQEILTQDELLVKLQLDAPFALKLTRKIQKAGVKIGNHITLEGLVDELCQLNLSK